MHLWASCSVAQAVEKGLALLQTVCRSVCLSAVGRTNQVDCSRWGCAVFNNIISVCKLASSFPCASHTALQQTLQYQTGQHPPAGRERPISSAPVPTSYVTAQ